MSTLLLRLAGPLQAWGTSSRYAYRFTDRAPSKSAIIGLLAAALGRRRSEPIEDLLGLRFGIRVDQPGSVVRDFQTARALDESYALPLSYRYYLGDAVFVAAVEGEDALIDGLHNAIHRPAFPLYLGRRSCPPAAPLVMGVRALGFVDSLRSIDAVGGVGWQASHWYRRKQPTSLDVEIMRDTRDGEVKGETASDVPLSFDPNHRRYGTRTVVHETVRVTNEVGRTPDGGNGRLTQHDAMAVFEEPS